MFDLFLQGGTWIMSILTVELICLLFAAWKAPAWVREIGLLVLVTDLIWQLKGMFNAAEVVQQVGDVPLTLVAGGLKVSFISLIYALLIYAASLVIRMLQDVYKRQGNGCPTVSPIAKCGFWCGRRGPRRCESTLRCRSIRRS